MHFKIYQRICAGVVHFWKDTTGNFGFEHFHSLSIHDGAGERDEDDSDSDNDDDDNDDDKGKEAVLSWTLNAGPPMMASGYMGLLKGWSFGQNQSTKDKATSTTVSRCISAPAFAYNEIQDLARDEDGSTNIRLTHPDKTER